MAHGGFAPVKMLESVTEDEIDKDIADAHVRYLHTLHK